VILKRRGELELMAEAGAINRAALEAAAAAIKPGVTTAELNRLAERAILSRGGKPANKGYHGFPATLCISVNDVVVHGFPSERRLARGDIVSLDLGTFYRGYAADMAATYPVGEVSAEARRLLSTAERALYAGIAAAQVGHRLGDISAAVQNAVEAAGLWVVREFVGHGLGRDYHEAPELPNYGRAGTGSRLRPGLVLAIEPMVTLRRTEVVIADDGWTARAADGSLAAHFEHTVAITADGPHILTAPQGAVAAPGGGVHGPS
jgi:methionyl aminopeptidase